jgi:hypothetical protein
MPDDEQTPEPIQGVIEVRTDRNGYPRAVERVGSHKKHIKGSGVTGRENTRYKNQCTATSKHTGQRCGRPASKGRNTCKFHGGTSAVSVAHPAYKTGKYSKYIPGSMLDSYAQAERDPELLSMRSEIALAEARVVALLGRVDTGESGKIWQELKATWKIFTTTRDDVEKKDSLRELGSLINRGHLDFQTWDAVFQAVEQKRRLQESEMRRRVAMSAMVDIQDAMALIGRILDIVRTEIHDAPTLTRVVNRIQTEIGT